MSRADVQQTALTVSILSPAKATRPALIYLTVSHDSIVLLLSLPLPPFSTFPFFSSSYPLPSLFLPLALEKDLFKSPRLVLNLRASSYDLINEITGLHHNAWITLFFFFFLFLLSQACLPLELDSSKAGILSFMLTVDRAE